jgi:hypothetical protein
MTEQTDLLASIAHTTKDYREGAQPAPTPEHVERWVKQFDPDSRLRVLREIDHVLKQTYFSRRRVESYLRGVMNTEALVGKDPCAFWCTVNFLDIQGGGNSQTEMLAIFDGILKKQCGYRIADCGTNSSIYLYIDDAIFSGNRVRRDIERWIQEAAPRDATLHIVAIASHSGGRYYADGRIASVISATGKKIRIKWWHVRKISTDTADVLRPTGIPDDKAVKAYVANMKYPPVLRKPGNVGSKGLFSADAERILLEQEFLKAGVRIRGLCQNLSDTQRPLGHMTLDTLGFGSLIVTFRNCPNNAPLAFWVGEPWYPLFARTTNTQTATKRLFHDLTKGTGR